MKRADAGARGSAPPAYGGGGYGGGYGGGRHAVPTNQPPPPRSSPPAHTFAAAAGNGYASDYGGSHDPGGIDTIVLLGAIDKGFTENQLEEHFEQMPGFVAWKPSPRVGGGFVKFQTHHDAKEAIAIAAHSDIEAQIAKNSMNFGDGAGKAEGKGQSHYQQPPPAHRMPIGASMSNGAPPYKKAKTDYSQDGVDTIFCVGCFEKGYTEEQIVEFFNQMPGFVMHKANIKVGGVFVKFQSSEMAQEAINSAIVGGLQAQLARKSMNA